MKKGYFSLCKWVACITMFISHLGAVLKPYVDEWIWVVTNTIGRVAFPLFVFLMIEAFYYTKNRPKHLLRIGIIALVSEVPFDLLTAGAPINYRYQNVCFTLFLGFLMLVIIHSSAYAKFVLSVKRLFETHLNTKTDKIGGFVSSVITLLIWCAFMFTAYLSCCDYGWFGIFLIGVLDFARRAKKKKSFVCIGIAAFAILNKNPVYAICVVDAFMIIYAWCANTCTDYRKTESKKNEMNKPLNNFSVWFFRAFYPVHLLVLGLLNITLPLFIK